MTKPKPGSFVASNTRYNQRIDKLRDEQGKLTVDWSTDFVSLHANHFGGFSLLAPLKAVYACNGSRPLWEGYTFYDYEDAKTYAIRLASRLGYFVVNCV